jgi:hypothetical protein
VFTPDTVEPVEFTDLDQILKLDAEKGEVTGTSASNGDHEVRTAGRLFRASIDDLPAPLVLTGPWRLKAEGGFDRRLQVLTSWTEFPELEGFSGTASYQSEIVIPESFTRDGRLLILDLGDICDVAEVLMNGEPAGVVWKHPFALDVSRHSRPGRNELEIRITNRLINRMRHQPPLPPPYTNLKDRVPEPIRSGLLGPVRLRSVQVLALKAVQDDQ